MVRQQILQCVCCHIVVKNGHGFKFLLVHTLINRKNGLIITVVLPVETDINAVER